MRAVVVIGFTGTIASGKTSRCAHLRALAERAAGGRAVRVHGIDADRVGHAVYAPGKPCYYDVVRHFGTHILASGAATNAPATAPAVTAPAVDTTTTTTTITTAATTTTGEPPIDRRVLGAIVFASPDKLRELSAICWPYIEAAVRDELHTVQQACREVAAAEVLVVVLEAAILAQSSGLLRLCTEVWMTYCRRDVAVARVMARNGLPAEDAARRVDSQSDAEAQLAQLRAQRDVFDGTVRRFDTTSVTLLDGLQQVEDAFAEFWRERVEVHLSPAPS